MSSANPQIVLPSEISAQVLWTRALGNLDEDLRDNLDLTTFTRTNILSIALREAREKRDLCIRKSWRFKKRNGEVIIVRDIVEKIIMWVQKFVAVGDAAMQYDPDHAAPAWGAFRFVLQMAVNEKSVLEDTIQNLETVARLIARYAIIEELHLKRTSAVHDQVQDLIVRLYTEILNLLAKAKKYLQSSVKGEDLFQRNSAELKALVRLIKSVTRFSEDEHMSNIKVLDGELSKLIEVFNIDTQIDTGKTIAAMRHHLASLDQPFQRMVDQSAIAARVMREGDHLRLLRWLSPVPFSSHNKRYSQIRVPGSGQWLLHHELYISWWNRSSSSILLLHGVLGSGKTSLASVVVDTFLEERSGHSSSAPLAYFFCSKNTAESERSDPHEILRSILRQLIVDAGNTSTVHERVLAEFEHRDAEAKVDGFDIRRLQADECVKLIVSTTSSNPATIVLDAIDEVNSQSRHVLLSALNQIVQDSSNVVKVFVTSRDDSNIQSLLPDAVALRIQERYVKRDLEVYVQQEVSSSIRNRRLLNGAVSEKLKETVIDTLVAGAGDMFIWAVRQLEHLCQLKTEIDIRSATLTLPRHTLQDIYEADFNRMSTSGQHARKVAVQVFTLLLCAQEALSLEAVLEALGTTTPEQPEITISALLNICSNLVVLDTELNVLRFSHISFQEYLTTKKEFALNDIHRIAATCCLNTCLEGPPAVMDKKSPPRTDFYQYSVLYWPEHCRLAMGDGVESNIPVKMREFTFDGDEIALTFIDWMEHIGNLTKTLPNDHALAKELNAVLNTSGSPLFTACIFGLNPVLDDLASRKEHDWNETNDLGQTGLYLAACAGHKVIVQSLLDHEIDVNTACGGKFGHTLHGACFSGHFEIAKILLGRGANPRIGRLNALQCAILGDHEDIALLLLNDTFSITNQAEFESILQQAAEAGFAEVVYFLQEKYTSLYGELGTSDSKAIQVAIFKGRIRVVERYMQRLRDAGKEMAKDAIATAALGGQDNMIRFLVDNGLNLDEEGILGTPLRSASIMAHDSTVRLLLNLGACPRISGSFGEPLQAAAMRGQESITKILLSHGADVNSQGGLYGTALQAAAHRGHIKIVEVLLDAGADVYRSGFSYNAISAASEGGRGDVIRLLSEKGFKLFNQRAPMPVMMRQDTLMIAIVNWTLVWMGSIRLQMVMMAWPECYFTTLIICRFQK
ncbi:MAG: hypothetical protein Q9213_007169 [Squamulea squamosa]